MCTSNDTDLLKKKQFCHRKAIVNGTLYYVYVLPTTTLIWVRIHVSDIHVVKLKKQNNKYKKCVKRICSKNMFYFYFIIFIFNENNRFRYIYNKYQV